LQAPEWLGARAVHYLHRRAIIDFGGHAGAVNEALLEAALARPRSKHADDNPDLAALAAAYGFALARRHCFADGNKRVAMLAIDVFLQINGRELIAPESEPFIMMTRSARCQVSCLQRFRSRNRRIPHSVQLGQ
jgi:death on curing protein